jgi:hypothetical protein
MTTTPMATRNTIREKTVPIGPYSLSSDITMRDMKIEKAASIPSQNSPVPTAGGNILRQETLPASRSHIVNHQNPVEYLSKINSPAVLPDTAARFNNPGRARL